MNFFEWIREAVRRAVLLGVSDAVEDLGTPPDREETRQQLLSVLRGNQPASRSRVGTSGKRKKLGRTLTEAAGQPNQTAGQPNPGG